MEGKRTIERMWILLAVGLLPFFRTEAQTPRQYLDFLYQYMPLPDRTDYSRDYYVRNVELALEARRQLTWGSKVPEREFRHFVLPVRVNNEHLDSCRSVFFQELKPRVEGLSMYDAVLEVNHWCHEHVTYRPSDARTSSPLATVRTAYGRCGEESTLLVAALRAVCIPARQVYTPRWAHTDDNHAWVEAWADGRWYFLGACEPEPVLNLGWFNESASRGMLMHTKVFGRYDGPEEVVSRTPCYTEINVTANYAPTSAVSVQVVDPQGKPVCDACVEFKLYNYAEFYTVAQKTTDAHGRASLTAGHGDMLLWVSKDGLTAVQKVSFDRDKEVRLALSPQQIPVSMDLDMVPPPVSAQLPPVTPKQRAENDRRLAQEDSIRQAYEQTMPVEEWRGNHDVIQQFLDEATDKDIAHRLLNVLSKKDLRDVELAVLRDNLPVSKAQASELFDKYVLCPRVENEYLTPYKSFFRHAMTAVQSPEQLVRWCMDSLQLDNGHNPQRLRMQPMSVYRERMTDDLGRDIFFVSVARSLGFPARINEVNGQVQYYKEGQWHTVDFAADKQQASNPPSESTTLLLRYKPVEYYDNPKYYIHFTLSRLENGRAQLLTYPEEATWKHDFAQGVQLEPGDYLLTTGTRLASGKVKARIDPIHVTGATQSISFTMREDQQEPQVIGSLNAEDSYFDTATASKKSLLSTTGRGYYIIGIIAPNQEPTNHALRDISACKQQFEQWGRKMMLLFQNADEAARFQSSEFDQLPSTVVWGIDQEGIILSEIREQMKLTSPSLPIFLICDTFNRVVFVQQGYTINLGEQLLKVIRKL